MNIKEYLKVYFIMGSNNCKGDPRVVLKEAIAGGITMFQFREKGEGALQGKEKYQLAYDLQQICKQHEVPFIVNDDVDLAIKLGADGIHIGQEDEKAYIVKEKAPHQLIGVSVHSIEELQQAIKDKADYVGMGPVFPTTTKTDTKAVQGTNLIQQARQQKIDFPIVGIGGIIAENAEKVIQGGADGISIITAISLARSPKQAAEQLLQAVK
ncbi:thiamine phosphate synthase [Priestia flexa]|uniref:thiamine phosphate synthase n=1 Tax=Priestia flexa TaxID=86664 RepID=UPI00099C5324|nr:thiamine phosphate synthase [Priestia flexa]AQX55054.1 thiamine-phosphate diphosphorylase [Priestia flexa]